MALSKSLPRCGSSPGGHSFVNDGFPWLLLALVLCGIFLAEPVHSNVPPYSSPLLTESGNPQAS